MSSKLLPITSREYKLVLKPPAFIDEEERLLDVFSWKILTAPLRNVC